MIGLGEKIKNLRIDKGITQPELAKILNVSNAVISFWENNQNEPKATYLKALAEYFQISVDYLLGLENDYGVKVAVSMGDACTVEERQLVTKYRELNPACKKLINTTIDTLVTTSTTAKK